MAQVVGPIPEAGGHKDKQERCTNGVMNEIADSLVLQCTDWRQTQGIRDRNDEEKAR